MHNPPVLKLIKDWKASLDRKRDLVASLVEVQSKLEDYEGDLSALLGEKRIAMYHNAYYSWEHFMDGSTAVGKYRDDISQITLKVFGCIYGQVL